MVSLQSSIEGAFGGGTDRPGTRHTRGGRRLGLVFTVFLCGLVSQPAAVTAGGGWHAGPPMSEGRRYPAAAASADGLIYVFGGFAAPVPGTASFPLLDSVEAYDPATGTWSARAPMPAGRVQMAAAPGADGRIYLFGGNDKHGFLNAVSIYDPAADSWTAGAPMPTRREAAAAVAGPDGRIYVMGGYDRAGARRKLEIYDPRTNNWSSGAPMPIGGYGLGAATGLDGKIYALGGYRQNYGDPALHIGGTLPYVQIYDPATGTWTAQKTMPTPRMYLGVVREKDGRIVAVGGTHPFAGALDVVEAYDPADGSWSSLPSLPTGREDLAAAASRNGSIYAIGGFDGHRTFLSTMDVYTP